MEESAAEPKHVYRARLDTSGRIVLPQPLRERLQVAAGDDVLVVRRGEHFRIETPDQALREAQAYFRSLVPPGVSLVDELLAERRAEVARDESHRE